MRKELTSGLLWMGMALMVAGCCKTKAGDTCTKGSAACLDEKVALSCQGDKYIESPCKGPKGCAVVGAMVKCDVSGNASGDPCADDDDGNGACAPGGKSQVVCRSGKYAIEPCRGPDACTEDANSVTCDVSVAELGETCHGMKAGSDNACSVDGKNLLTCKDNKVVLAHPCGGAEGCKVESDGIACDQSVATIGEVCEGSGGGYACDKDGKTLLQCTGGKFTKSRACKGAKGCDASGEKILCD